MPSEADKTCATCAYYRLRYFWGNPLGDGHMCDGDPDGFVRADASDDTGLQSGFYPPPEFGCNRHQPKDQHG